MHNDAADDTELSADTAQAAALIRALRSRESNEDEAAWIARWAGLLDTATIEDAQAALAATLIEEERLQDNIRRGQRRTDDRLATEAGPTVGNLIYISRIRHAQEQFLRSWIFNEEKAIAQEIHFEATRREREERAALRELICTEFDVFWASIAPIDPAGQSGDERWASLKQLHEWRGRFGYRRQHVDIETRFQLVKQRIEQYTTLAPPVVPPNPVKLDHRKMALARQIRQREWIDTHGGEPLREMLFEVLGILGQTLATSGAKVNEEQQSVLELARRMASDPASAMFTIGLRGVLDIDETIETLRKRIATAEAELASTSSEEIDT